METQRGLFWVAAVCFLVHARGQGDFDLADALDDNAGKCSPPRSRTQTFIRSQNPHTARSPDSPTPAEIFTQGRSHPRLAHSLAIPTVEVTSVTGTGTMAATRPGPGLLQEAAEAVAATTPVTTATEAAMAEAVEAATVRVTEEGALDPTPVDIIMVETATIPMATRKATRWRKSCLPSSPWWWSRWWAPRPPTSSATGGEIASEPTPQRTSEDLEVPRGKAPCGQEPRSPLLWKVAFALGLPARVPSPAGRR